MDHPRKSPIQWPRAAASAAVFREGKILRAQRAKEPLAGIWSLPGGHIEPGEKALDAAIRELREETGIQADLKGIADVKDVILHNDDGSLRAHYVITAFYGVWRSGAAQPLCDTNDVEWVELTALEDRPLTEGAAEIILRAAKLLGLQD